MLSGYLVLGLTTQVLSKITIPKIDCQEKYGNTF